MRRSWRQLQRTVGCQCAPRSLLDLQKERCPVNEIGEVREKRRYQRLELEVEVIVRTDSALLPGRTQDISECGMSAILPVELREGQEVELQIRLPSATRTVRAIVRHRNVFRHGFEIVQPLHGIFRNEAATGGCSHTQLLRLKPCNFPPQAPNTRFLPGIIRC